MWGMALVGATAAECGAKWPVNIIEDLAGHRWTFTKSIADIEPVEWGGRPGKL
jgi:hypothetical protein